LDTITHALSGALLARVVAPHLPQGNALTLRRALTVGALTAAFPDSDVVINFFSDQLTYLNLHRGVTHSLIMLPLWAFLLALIFSLLDRKHGNRRSYFILAVAGIAIHIAGDVITSYGTQIFAPFSSWKAAIPVTFIIDLWFTGIIIAGLLASWWWRNSTRPAWFALAVLAGYVGFQGVLSVRAVELGEKYAWQHGYHGAQVVALPQPLSPFNWKIIVTSDDHYDIAYVNLRRHTVPPTAPAGSGLFAHIEALYQPVAALTWQHQARFGDTVIQQTLGREVWEAPVMAGVRRFMEYPELAQVNHREPQGTCVWFEDLRFTLSTVRSPFRFGACRSDQAGDWRLFRQRDGNVTPL
jgi:inner membrane protein